MEQFYNKHYIKIDSSNRVVEGWSDGPHRDKDTTDAICINDKGGYQFRINGGEENPPLFDWNYMIPLYKWENNQIVLRSEEEIEADRIIASQPTAMEQIAALKAQLESTDYKIIKCSEAQLVGEEMPYDIIALHAERQSIRDQINQLEV